MFHKLDKKRDLKIIILGNYDGSNVGDTAILHTIIERLKDWNKNIQIVIPSRNPKWIKQTFKVISVKPFTFNLLKHFLNTNVVIIGGGGIFSSYVGKFAKLIPMVAIFSKLFGKKVMYYNLGIYSTCPKWLINLVQFSMVFADDVSVRDTYSISTIKFISKLKKVKVFPDLAIKLKFINKKRAFEILSKENINTKKTLIGISLKPTKDKKVNIRIIKEFSKLFHWILKNFNAELIFFPFCFNKERWFENDFIIANEIKKTIPQLKIIKSKKDPRILKGLVGAMNLFIGMRFHSMVFANSFNIPFIGIIYDDKCKNFLKDFNKVGLELDEIEFHKLKKNILQQTKLKPKNGN